MAATAQLRKAGRPQGAPETRDDCLRAAERLFATKGFAGTGMREIASASGVTIATLAYHFGSKEKLYGKVLLRLAESIEPYLPATDGGAGNVEAVISMVERFLDWSLDHQHYAWLLLRELMENPDRAQRAKRWYLLPLIDGYAAAIRRGQESGAFGPCDAEMFAFYVTGAISHFRVSTVTIQRMLSVPEAEMVVARFRETLRANVRAMLSPHTG